MGRFKRLEEGSLLCFVAIINTKSSLLFLTIGEKRTDPKAAYNLSSHDHINTKLATRNQSDLENLIQLSSQRTRGALVELPGNLLAMFLPILENLQNLHRFGSFPFRQWILPDRHTEPTKQPHILPPLYAMCHAEYHERRIEGVHQCARVGGAAYGDFKPTQVISIALSRFIG